MNSAELISLTDKMRNPDMDDDAFAAGFKQHLSHTLGLIADDVNPRYIYEALALTVKDKLIEQWNKTRLKRQTQHRHAYYLSMEYLIGRTLNNAILNLDLSTQVKQLLAEIGVDQEQLEQHEKDAALGNGGLGRLAACFLDSCATLDLPVTGYGIRYEYGMFKQLVHNGFQVEKPDHWLRKTHIWETKRPWLIKRIKFGGQTEHRSDEHGNLNIIWHSDNDVYAIPFDIPIPGYKTGTVNTLRLWKAEANEDLQLEEFNAGNYAEAVAEKIAAEKISMLLYPNDATENGKSLRLCQQYFLASASLQDVLTNWVEKNGTDFSRFAEFNCFQLNDTHPACAVAELMRLLMDEYKLPWDQAWGITTQTMAYTNHTLLPEALEKWPVDLFESLLPRLKEIIFEINARFLSGVAERWPGNVEMLKRMSIIEEGQPQMIRMAFLSIVGSHSVNGVAALHSNLLKQELFKDFYYYTPDKFNNKTNGVTFRRWLVGANPMLSNLICEAIGDSWIKHSEQLTQLESVCEDDEFQRKWQDIRNQNKSNLAEFITQQCQISLNTDSIFDIQVKRIHEYKRQLLNVLHAIHLYLKIKLCESISPRSIIIAGKAAPGYRQAKLIIKLINNVATIINSDKDCKGQLNLVFLPNYRVSTMELICPGTDLSAQISTAGCEASGTGNMKFMLNGALTIGTLDGANIEILQAVGKENFFQFGLTVDEVRALSGQYDPSTLIKQNPDLEAVVALLKAGHFNQFEPGLFDPIIDSILDPNDPWKTAADFGAFVDAHSRAADAFQNKPWWTKTSILNTAYSGWFSSDRTIREYNEQIWRL